ncbi:MAG: prepilin-type N-terminal cleavage/methylation domain-containing protein [Undibacterium sp.]|nr:prepilin-type N-terminal cleavage/methylation domain-containing protein [Undibacterium sp.]
MCEPSLNSSCISYVKLGVQATGQSCTDRRDKGFTMMELIMVIVIFGILSAIVAPRFANRVDFESVGFFDQTQNMIRYAQKLAIAQRRNVWVQISATSICLAYDGATPDCSTAPLVLEPNGSVVYSMTAPNGVTFGAATSFSFSPLGRLATDPSVSIQVLQTGVGTTGTIVVEGVTGYVH